ncbi:AlpA family transcriptional regulator [Pigmentiphaga sp. D-2]|uniref:helix-turn-helix transcriptional regulator n=1 Tax=Pigmentiphaga sp. D-2 TaxID=1002116 RepID=UPI0010428CF6|nr:AlpA family transcriptional regulator [Pigmentiphaga sp. D-2]
MPSNQPLNVCLGAASSSPHQYQLLRRAAVEKMTGLSRSSIYALHALGKFPGPVPIGPKAVRWLAHEIQAWIAEKVDHRQ